MKTNKEIIKKAKSLRVSMIALLAFYIIYNCWYGWNDKPIDDVEAFLDKVTVFGVWFWVVSLISLVITFIEYVAAKDA